MKKVLLLGGTGYIGRMFKHVLKQRKYEIRCLSRKDVDYTDSNILTKYIDINWLDFTKECIVINCAGYTGKPNVDECEIKKDITLKGNVVFPLMLSHVCRPRGIPLCHISSGCIYSGTNKGVGFTEDDEPNFTFKYNNCSFYSGTKALCEEALKENSMCYQFRLRIPFDETDNVRNYLTKCLQYEKLVDVENSLSHRRDFANYCLDLIECGAPYGIYNVTNKGSITTKGVVALLRKYVYPNLKPDYFKTYEDFEKIISAPRSSCVLDTTKLEQYVNVRSVEDALRDALRNWYEVIIHENRNK